MKGGSAVDKSCSHARTSINEVASNVNGLGKDGDLERRPAYMVATVDVDAVLDRSDNGLPVVRRNRIEELLRDANIRLLRPLPVINWVEAAGDALTAGVLDDKSFNTSSMQAQLSNFIRHTAPFHEGSSCLPLLEVCALPRSWA